MNIKKLAVQAGASISTLALMATPAFANVEGSNDTTGSHSNNEVNNNINLSATLTQSNHANITNDINIWGNTGGNTANHNTGDGSVTTGDASAEVIVTNTANSNTLNLGGFNHGSWGVTGSNSTTGSHSNNEVNNDIRARLRLRQENRARVRNRVRVNQNTGDNAANHNTGNGSVSTGGTSANTTVDTVVNNNEIGS